MKSEDVPRLGLGRPYIHLTNRSKEATGGTRRAYDPCRSKVFHSLPFTAETRSNCLANPIHVRQDYEWMEERKCKEPYGGLVLREFQFLYSLL